MRKIVLSQAIRYGKEDVNELESASIKVRKIYDKTISMLAQHVPDSVRKYWACPRPAQEPYSEGGEHGGTVFQKWIQSPSGWKCIGCERHYVESLDAPGGKERQGKREYVFHNGSLQSMMLQLLIWSQFEEISLFHPVLGDAPFYDDEEMEVISAYFVPTYVTPIPFEQSGKPFKKHNTRIPVYQELISAPPLLLHLDGEVLEGTWMTGVYVDRGHFLGLGPYLKNTDGTRTFMQALIH
ncbi:hypothetical protein [Paenibacillus cookii]|uniref:Uncharacterized protein n=1 Tax=Paenibacillus cookii TaxID=157839 RepID=A0ABQ4LQ58_9BACL|nr:hypothetical protein [Paenibacillus cookii]KHF36788.1 hypothetical protein CM49_01094 [Paenibacillus sp. P1XP2]GIO65392.1 hypothetical protein J21TS3_02130 [Paenibacillus cookii]